jgi:serine/threonine protein kinase
MIYRDLKPENVLLNEKGEAKLTDMGLATICVGKTFTKCGTALYLAPEMIAQTGHDASVDWWMLGVLIYELMTGSTPFEASEEALLYARINKGIDSVYWPSESVLKYQPLVKGLCRANPAERLPRKKGGIDNIKNDTFYDGFDWAALKCRLMPPPYVPHVQDKTDMENFFSSDAEKPKQVKYAHGMSQWEKEFASGKLERSVTVESSKFNKSQKGSSVDTAVNETQSDATPKLSEEKENHRPAPPEIQTNWDDDFATNTLQRPPGVRFL